MLMCHNASASARVASFPGSLSLLFSLFHMKTLIGLYKIFLLLPLIKVPRDKATHYDEQFHIINNIF